MLSESDLKKFSLLYYQGDLIVIVSNEMKIPYINDYLSSEKCLQPVDFSDPSSWDHFHGYLLYNITQERYTVMATCNLVQARILENDGWSEFIPSDLATSKLRVIVSLLALADKLRGQEGYFSFLTKLTDKNKE